MLCGLRFICVISMAHIAEAQPVDVRALAQVVNDGVGAEIFVHVDYGVCAAFGQRRRADVRHIHDCGKHFVVFLSVLGQFGDALVRTLRVVVKQKMLQMRIALNCPRIAHVFDRTSVVTDMRVSNSV